MLILKRRRKPIYSTPVGEIADGEAVAYTEDGKRVSISYDVQGNLIGFKVNGWDKNKKLIIDPSPFTFMGNLLRRK